MIAIRLKADGSYWELEIDEAHEGVRDRSGLPKDLRGEGRGVLVSEGGVDFRTRAGKKWFIRYSEFSFVVNPAVTPKAA